LKRFLNIFDSDLDKIKQHYVVVYRYSSAGNIKGSFGRKVAFPSKSLLDLRRIITDHKAMQNTLLAEEQLKDGFLSERGIKQWQIKGMKVFNWIREKQFLPPGNYKRPNFLFIFAVVLDLDLCDKNREFEYVYSHSLSTSSQQTDEQLEVFVEGNV